MPRFCEDVLNWKEITYKLLDVYCQHDEQQSTSVLKKKQEKKNKMGLMLHVLSINFQNWKFSQDVKFYMML